MTILAVVLAFMEFSGLPAVLFVNFRLADVTPYILSMMVNFLIMGLLAFIVIKIFGKGWPLGFQASGLADGFIGYAVPGILSGFLSCVAFITGLRPFDYEPTVWKVLIEGVIYYIGVAIIEELYVRGLFLNIVEKIAHKKKNSTVIAVWVSAIVFALGHIPGMIGMDAPVIVGKVIANVGMGLYFGVLYKWTNNLWLPIIMHILFDICALPYCFSTFSGYKTISLVGFVIAYILLGIYSTALMKFVKRPGEEGKDSEGFAGEDKSDF